MSKAVQQALISVSDKSGLVEFAQGLADRGIAILSTGGTYKKVKACNIALFGSLNCDIPGLRSNIISPD